jgi:hypothetical protein
MQLGFEKHVTQVRAKKSQATFVGLTEVLIPPFVDRLEYGHVLTRQVADGAAEQVLGTVTGQFIDGGIEQRVGVDI